MEEEGKPNGRIHTTEKARNQASLFQKCLLSRKQLARLLTTRASKRQAKKKQDSKRVILNNVRQHESWNVQK